MQLLLSPSFGSGPVVKLSVVSGRSSTDDFSQFIRNDSQSCVSVKVVSVSSIFEFPCLCLLAERQSLQQITVNLFMYMRHDKLFPQTANPDIDLGTKLASLVELDLLFICCTFYY